MGCEMIATGGSQLWNSNNFSFSTSLRPLSAWREASEDGQRQSTINHMTQKSIEIASDVQEYAQRPSFMRTENTTGANDSVIDLALLNEIKNLGFASICPISFGSRGAGDFWISRPISQKIGFVQQSPSTLENWSGTRWATLSTTVTATLLCRSWLLKRRVAAHNGTHCPRNSHDLHLQYETLQRSRYDVSLGEQMTFQAIYF
jgi:hypothetical protein